jgi:multiple sugar transport system ATP-binding protein
MTLADRIVVMHGGTVQQVGTPHELYNEPANLFVAGFIGSPKMNFINSSAAQAEGAKTLGVRPEHLVLSRESPRWTGRVRHLEYLGSDSYLFVRTESAGELTVRVVGAQDGVAVGDEVGVSPVAGRLLKFDEEGLRMPMNG